MARSEHAVQQHYHTGRSDPRLTSAKVGVSATQHVVKCIELFAREAHLVALLPLILVRTAELLEGVCDLAMAKTGLGIRQEELVKVRRKCERAVSSSGECLGCNAAKRWSAASK